MTTVAPLSNPPSLLEHQANGRVGQSACQPFAVLAQLVVVQVVTLLTLLPWKPAETERASAAAPRPVEKASASGLPSSLTATMPKS